MIKKLLKDWDKIAIAVVGGLFIAWCFWDAITGII